MAVALVSCTTLAREPEHVLCSDLPDKQSLTDYRSSYCDQLTAMHEPAIPSATHPDSTEIYRLLWFRSFHPLVIVRIDMRSDGSGLLTLHADRTILSEKQLESRQSAQPIDSIRTISSEQVAEFRRLIGHQDFWNVPSQFHLDMGFGPFATPIPKEQQIVVSDGAEWVIEGQKGSRYRVTGDEGVALGEDGPVQQIGLAMIKLAQITNPQWLTGPIY